MGGRDRAGLKNKRSDREVRAPLRSASVPDASRRKRDSPQKAPKVPEREPWTPWGKWAKARRERRERKAREREARRAARRRARELRRMRRRRLTARGIVFLALLVLACGIGGLVLLLLGRPYPWEAVGDVTEVLRLSRLLSERRARWESLAVYHYVVEIEYTDTSGAWCGPSTIEVQAGQIMDLPSSRDTHWFPPETCAALFRDLIPDHAFEWLEQQLARYRPGETYLSIRFDPDFGYPVYAEAGVYGEPAPGCCWKVTWQALRPLYDE